MRYATLYKGIGNSKRNIVRDDPDLFLLHCYYHKNIDTLFVLYKRYSTGEKFMDKIVNPYVPVYVAKSELKSIQEYIRVESTHCYTIPYANKRQEALAILFMPKIQRYKDEYGLWVEKPIYPDIPSGAEALHPRLFLYDLPIEQLVYMEYNLNRYHERQSRKGDTLLVSDIEVPKISYASFDIETNVDENDEWIINTNTFVDQDSMTAYVDILKNDRYTRQDEMLEDIDNYISEVRKAMDDMIENCALHKSKKGKIQSYARDFMSKLKFKVRAFDTEAELIAATSKLMFTQHKPDILMAYNTTYDVGMFNERIKKIQMLPGTFNEQGIGYDEIVPPLVLQIRNDGSFKGDTINPTKRVVYLNNISHTMISDLQTCYYSNRSQFVPENYKLQTTAEIVLGFGKYDYTHITPDIAKLAETDFFFHSVYAVIDSILLLMINDIGSEFEGKLRYCMNSKVNIEASPQSSTATIRGVHADAIVKGNIPGSNVNAALSRLQKSDMLKISELLEVDFSKLWHSLQEKESFGGGIVADTNLYNFDFSDNIYKNHQLHNEMTMSLFRHVIDSGYYDFASHYPNTIVTRNLSKGTLYGNIVSTSYANTILETKNAAVAKQYGLTPSKNMGKINMAIINRDIVDYGHIVNRLPSLADLISKHKSLDSKPLFSKPVPAAFHIDYYPKKIKNLFSILKQCNNNSLTESEQGFENSDNGMFLAQSGCMRYMGTLVKLDYLTPTDFSGYPDAEYYYASYGANGLDIDDSKINLPKNKPYEVDDTWSEWHKIPFESWMNVYSNSDKFLVKIELDNDIAVYCNKQLLYYPWKWWAKSEFDKELIPIYRYCICENTVKLIIAYNITIDIGVKDSPDERSVNIEQHMRVLFKKEEK